ncbi:MAG: MMPL family transporter, partial [Alphaproteobacteria bacterium]|nr:MMPL family transporter [Alphaproteobacteria bacterium]
MKNDTPLERGLMRLAHVTWHRPGLVLALVAIVTVLMGVLAMDLRMDSSFMGILDDDDPAMLRFAETSRRFPSSSSVVLVLTEGEESERQQAAEAAAQALEQLDIVSAATARVDTEIAAEIGLVYINDAEFDRLRGSLEALAPLTQGEPTLPGALQAIADRLSAPQEAPVDPQEALGALDGIIGLIHQIAALPSTEEAVTEGLVGSVFPAPERGPGGALLRDGYLASADGRVYAVDLRTDLDPLSVEIGAGSFAVMEAQIEPVRAQHPDVVLRFAGLLPGAYQDQQNVLNKIVPLSTLTLTLVLLALTALDRSPVTSLAVGLCLLTSMVWTFGLVRLVFGYASLMVTACGIMLFGLGVDYAVHIVVRYNDERASGV